MMPVYKYCTKGTQKVMHMLNYKMYIYIYISLNKKNLKTKNKNPPKISAPERRIIITTCPLTTVLDIR